MSRLDSNGVLHDMAFDSADRRETALPAGGSAGLLRTLEDERIAERGRRDHSALGRAIPGYFRLP